MNLTRIQKRENLKIIIVDLLMMGLLIINLALIIFDWIFVSQAVQSLLREYMPNFFYWYRGNIHENFITIDLYFVAVYVAELILSWIIAIKRNTYHKWFFYPFVHWYDVLGSVPIGTLHFLRILRVFSILVRFQKLKIIDLTKTYLYSQFKKYLNIVMEEISDRVIVKILEMIQDEIKQGGPITDRIVEEIVKPQKDVMVDWISRRIQKITTDAHDSYHEDFQKYLDKLIRQAIDQNKEIGTIEMIPVFGGFISSTLERAISDIVYNVFTGVVSDLASAQNKALISNISDITIESILSEEDDEQLNEVARDILLQAVELIKEQVKVQQWKVKEVQEKEAKLRGELKKTAEE